MRKPKLTAVQDKLLKIVTPLLSDGKAIPYDNLKRLSEFKSFDGTFNAILSKGYLKSVKTADYSNQFKLA